MLSVPSAAAEFSGAPLGDARLSQRAVSLAECLSRRPSAGFPSVFGDEAELEAFYRFVNNDSVSPAAVLAPHHERSWVRSLAAGPTVLVLHDTSEFKFSGDGVREGLAASGEKQSFHGHAAIAVGEDEAPVVHGVVGFDAYVLQDGVWSGAGPGRELEPLVVGSERWSLLAEEARLQAPEELQLVHVMDREADDYGLWTRIVEGGDDFVIRAQNDRRVTDSAKRLYAQGRQQEFVVSRTVTLSRRRSKAPPRSRKTHPDRDVRDARLSIRACSVEVIRPEAVAPLGQETMALSFVEVVEMDPPDGVEPVHWRLLSTLPIDTAEQVLRVVDIYRKRWLIEEFFKALKTGCSAEKRQGRSLWSLLNTTALLIPVAWRLLCLRTAARHQPKEPLEEHLDAVEMQALRHLDKGKRLPTTPTVGDGLLAVARLGGHLRSNGEPGWLVLGRGLERLIEFADGWRAALASVDRSGSTTDL